MDGALPAALLCTHIDRVIPAWIDYNGHMNVAYYVVLMDRAMDGFLGQVGIGETYLKRENKSTFALDVRISYRKELRVDMSVRCYTQLFDFDAKRFQVGHYVTHAEEGWTAAYSEWVGVHVDMATRKSAPMPPHATERLGALLAAHRSIPRPAELARPFGLGKGGVVSV
jgi:acyl-CoA thioester hydrolase